MIRVLIILLFLLLPISCSSNDIEGKVIAQRSALANIYVALFLYYIDNKKFPPEKEGLLYGLLKTGKNPPYYIPEKDAAYYYDCIRRENGEEIVRREEGILPGDRYFSPFGKEYTYQVLKKKKGFKLFGRGDEYFLNQFPIIDDKLTFSNLSRLDYKRISKFKTGADYIHKSHIFYLNFYLKKSKAK